jgi:hypothetical protein
MPHFCPKKQYRIFPEVCRRLCPNDWESRIDVGPDGSLDCKFKTDKTRRLEARSALKRAQIRKNLWRHY